MFEVKAIIRPERVNNVRLALREIEGVPGVTVSKVHAFARMHPHDLNVSPDAFETDLVKLEMVVPAAVADSVIDAIQQAATTGRPGDGMIFKIPVADAVRVRSGERGVSAL
jgi:nitrogen regulatory protein P-II 1